MLSCGPVVETPSRRIGRGKRFRRCRGWRRPRWKASSTYIYLVTRFFVKKYDGTEEQQQEQRVVVVFQRRRVQRPRAEKKRALIQKSEVICDSILSSEVLFFVRVAARVLPSFFFLSALLLFTRGAGVLLTLRFRARTRHSYRVEQDRRGRDGRFGRRV